MTKTAARTLPLWLLGAAVTGGVYLLAAHLTTGAFGLPLDDAWIHQTYARNLVETGQWAFIPGQVSAGSTAPLWSLLLSLGYVVRIPFLVWTYALGILFLGLTAWTADRLSRRVFPEAAGLGAIVGLSCLAEWHLVWAAVSGMETALFTWLALLLLLAWQQIDAEATWRRFLVLGLLGGLLLLTRPEGVLLVGLVGMAIGWQQNERGRSLLAAWLPMALGLLALIMPYVVFHLITAGTPFPNTFYAKQQEYRSLLEMYPLWQRWLQMVGTSLVGGHVLLLPGFLGAMWLLDREAPPNTAREGAVILFAWWLLHLTLYAFRLPVTYQHGRYLMPILPPFIILGWWGTQEGLARIRIVAAARVLRRTTLLAAALVFVAFLGIGARAYAADVGFIEGEMVTVARWLAQHTE
jgi:hypothetical protein